MLTRHCRFLINLNPPHTPHGAPSSTRPCSHHQPYRQTRTTSGRRSVRAKLAWAWWLHACGQAYLWWTETPTSTNTRLRRREQQATRIDSSGSKSNGDSTMTMVLRSGLLAKTNRIGSSSATSHICGSACLLVVHRLLCRLRVRLVPRNIRSCHRENGVGLMEMPP